MVTSRERSALALLFSILRSIFISLFSSKCLGCFVVTPLFEIVTIKSVLDFYYLAWELIYPRLITQITDLIPTLT